MKKILPITILIVAVALCLVSFRNQAITVVFEGHVFDISNPVPGVEIYLEKEDLGKEVPFYTATDADGNYKLQINADENELIYLRFEKEGYETKRKKHFPTSDNLRPKLEVELERQSTITKLSDTRD